MIRAQKDFRLMCSAGEIFSKVHLESTVKRVTADDVELIAADAVVLSPVARQKAPGGFSLSFSSAYV